jgi:hypothetical protein
MKLIFIKNLKNNALCSSIFDYLLVADYKENTNSFIKDFKAISETLDVDEDFIINNINETISKFKMDNRAVEDSTECDLIKVCLSNNQDFDMRIQLNLVTYAGPLYNKENV